MTDAVQIAEGLWTIDGPAVRWCTFPFPTRMTLMRLGDGRLLMHSPIELTSKVRDAVESLGTPRCLVSPNKLHHLFWAKWQSAYRDASSFAPPGLAQKRPDLAFDGELGDRPEPAWAQEVDQLVFKGSRVLDEVVFFHRASRTLVLGDLVENFDPQSLSLPHRMLARFGHVLAPHGQTPLDLRQTFAMRRDEARRSLERLLGWQPQVVLMCHGLPVHEHAESFLEAAFAWVAGVTSRSDSTSLL